MATVDVADSDTFSLLAESDGGNPNSGEYAATDLFVLTEYASLDLGYYTATPPFDTVLLSPAWADTVLLDAQTQQGWIGNEGN